MENFFPKPIQSSYELALRKKFRAREFNHPLAVNYKHVLLTNLVIIRNYNLFTELDLICSTWLICCLPFFVNRVKYPNDS